jgi:hypothetical protein
MSRKSIVLALAAVASFGIAFSSTSASAFVGHGGHGPGVGARIGGMGGMHINALRVSHPNFAFRRIVRVHPHWHPHWHFGWRRPYWIAPVVATGAVTYAAAPTWNRCSCLTKEYTPEGAVVFKDLCTKEMAMNPPDNPGAASDLAPQPPQQQGYLQPQPGYLQPQAR